MRHKQYGVAVIGSGRMGTLRATVASTHPAVEFLAVSDIDPDKARKLAQSVNADLHSGDNSALIRDERVGAVIVSTSEPEHAAPAIEALELGKPVLVEKPIALTVTDADRMIAASRATGASIRVGYSLRFNRQFLVGRQQIVDGKLGRITGMIGRFFNSKSNAIQVLNRSAEATFVKDALTYLVDLFGWYLDDAKPVEVIARSSGVVYRDQGFDADENTFAIVTFDNGTIANLSIGYALPADYPSHGRLIRAEVLGDRGVLLLDQDHRENILHTEIGSTHAYAGTTTNMSFLTSNASGNKALGGYWGPLGDETRSWLDFIATGNPCPHATGEQARTTLEVTTAIDMAAALREPITLPLSPLRNA